MTYLPKPQCETIRSMSTRKRPRAWVDLPEQLVDDLHVVATEQGTNAAALCFHWVVEAARLAARGYGAHLPQERRARRHSLGGAVKPVTWAQNPDDYRRCKALIDEAGSSVPAVLRHAVRRYLEAGGDVVAMTWPAKGAVAVAA